MEAYIFYFLIALTVCSGLGILFTQKVLNAALFLIVCLLCVAGIYVFAKADFIAVTQILVYIGGVMVLLIFGIMLSSKNYQKDSSTTLRKIVAGITGVFLMLFLSNAIVEADFSSAYQNSESFNAKTTTHIIGKQIMTDFIFPFEIAAFILLIALIAAAYVADKKEEVES